MKHLIAGLVIAVLATAVACPLKAQNTTMEKKTEFKQIFPLGEKNVGFQKYFIGQSYLAPISNSNTLNTHIFNVTFEPGCRNNWHSHTGGQRLSALLEEDSIKKKGNRHAN